VYDKRNDTQWSFAPRGHYAYPAVVRRKIEQNPDGNVFVRMSSLCEADKASCDKLIDEFKQLNERIRQGTQPKTQKGSATK